MRARHVVGLTVSALFGLWLLSNPRCNRGCRTVAEHLVLHFLDDFLGGVLA